MTRGNAREFFRTVRPWQWIKHTIFTQYLKVWAYKVGSPPLAKSIWVIDAFAGAGEFRDEWTGETAPGSPVRAALVAKEYNESPKKKAEGKTLRLICVERNAKHYAALCERLKGFDFVTILRGEFEEHAEQIAQMIGDDPALVLLDPIGVKSIHADVCRKLLQRRGKTDAFVNVQFAIVHRVGGMLLPDGEADPTNAVAKGNVENIDEFFGTKDWRKIALSDEPKDAREDAYLQLPLQQQARLPRTPHLRGATSLLPGPDRRPPRRRVAHQRPARERGEPPLHPVARARRPEPPRTLCRGARRRSPESSSPRRR
jgi:three-Cys-motif partner protein